MIKCLHHSAPAHLLHTFDGADFLDELFELGGVVHHDGEGAREETVVRVDGDATEHEVLFFGDDGGDVVDNAYIIVSHHTEADFVLRTGILACPTGLDDAVAEALAKLRSIGTIATVHLDASTGGDKTEDIVRITPSDAGNGVLSFAQEVVDAQGNVVLPVFTNGAEPGSLSVTKWVTGTADPQQEFTFHVRLTGENLPEEIEYVLSAAKAAISELLRTLPGNKAMLASAAAPGARANDHYVLSESDAALTPLARLDADGNLVIFRAAPNADGTYTFSDGVTITFTEGIYDVKSGDVYYYLLSNTENPSQATFNWPWFDEYSLVKTVSMEGGLKPASTSGMFKSPNL